MINTSKASASSLSEKTADCEWASEQCMGAVSAAYSHLLEKAKTKGGCDDITVADIAQETKMPPMTVTACLWTITNGECLPGARPIKENILRVLKEIDLYHGAYGCSPTIREIQDDLNLSLSTIKNIVASLGLDEAWWTNITVAAMICLFLVIQSLVLARKNKKSA